MFFFNYLFVRLLSIGIYERVYWGKILITCIEMIAFEPLLKTLYTSYFGCHRTEIPFYILGLLLLLLNSIYYSPKRIGEMKETCKKDSSTKRNIKLLIIVSLLLMVFLFADDLVRQFLITPIC
jgi:hypothetical protein